MALTALMAGVIGQWRDEADSRRRFIARAVREVTGFRVPASPMSRFVIWAVGLYAVVQGVRIILGGIIRWSGPSYSIVRQLPYSPTSWGIALAAAGVIVLVGSLARLFHLKALGLSLVAVWSFSFGIGAEWATQSVPVAGTTGGPAYFLHFIFALSVLFVDERDTAVSVSR